MPEALMDVPNIEPLERWRLFRNYLEHEDGLIHQRINWMLLLQGFLFAAYASIYCGLLESSWDKQSELHVQIHQQFASLIETLLTFSRVIPIVGYSISLFSLLGVHAARQAIERLEKRWDKEQYRLPDSCRKIPCSEYFPRITGGGAKHVKE